MPSHIWSSSPSRLGQPPQDLSHNSKRPFSRIQASNLTSRRQPVPSFARAGVPPHPWYGSEHTPRKKGAAHRYITSCNTQHKTHNIHHTSRTIHQASCIIQLKTCLLHHTSHIIHVIHQTSCTITACTKHRTSCCKHHASFILHHRSGINVPFLYTPQLDSALFHKGRM